MSEVQTGPEIVQPQVDQILLQETSLLAQSALDNRASEIAKEVEGLTTDERQAKYPSGSPESALLTYHQLGNMQEGRIDPPHSLTGQPLVLFKEGNNVDTFQAENAQKFQVSTIRGAHRKNGELFIECDLVEPSSEGGMGQETLINQHIPARLLQDAQSIAIEPTLLADTGISDSQKTLIKAHNQLQSQGVENVQTPHLEDAVKTEAEAQGKLLADPLKQLLTQRKDALPSENITEEQIQTRDRIDQALATLEDHTLATPECYAAVLGALGPAEVQAQIAQEVLSIEQTKQNIKQLETALAAAPADQKLAIQEQINQQKNTLEEASNRQKRLQESLTFFDQPELLTKAMELIQSADVSPEVAKSVNEKMANGDFAGGLGELVQNKFDQLDEQTKQTILKGLGKKAGEALMYGGGGIALMTLLFLFNALNEIGQ